MPRKISCFYDNTYYEFEIRTEKLGKHLNVKSLFEKEYNVKLSKLAAYMNVKDDSMTTEEEITARRSVLIELMNQFDHNFMNKPIDLSAISKKFTKDKKINRNLVKYIDELFSKCVLVQSFAISSSDVNAMISSIGRQKNLFGEESLDSQNELFSLAVSNSRFLEQYLYKLEENENGMSLVPDFGKRTQIIETEKRNESAEKESNLETTDSPKVLDNINEVSVEKENEKVKEYTKKIS